MIRIGIVGCGRIMAAHLRGYRLLREAGVDDFRITALCERKADDALMYVKRGEGPPQRPAVSKMPGDPLAVGDEYLSDFQDDVDVEVFTDYKKMIAEGPIDAVNDFSTHALHHQVAAAAFAHGKDLMTQKALAVSVRAALRMCEAAEANDRVFGVFENHRFRAENRYLHWLFDSGLCGDLQMALMCNVGTWWAPDRIVAHTPWRHLRSEGGGIALDLGTHQFHAMRHLAGAINNVQGRTAVLEPVRVSIGDDGSELNRIECDADDTVWATFETETGVTGSLAASWAGHGASTVLGNGRVFYGSKGRVTGDTVTLDDGDESSLKKLYDENCGAQRKEKDFPLGLESEFARTQLDWLQAVRQRREPEASGREGLMDLACAFAVLESDLAGRRVYIDEVMNGSIDAYQKRINDRFNIL
jgi:predicted dehydrogenase